MQKEMLQNASSNLEQQEHEKEIEERKVLDAADTLIKAERKHQTEKQERDHEIALRAVVDIGSNTSEVKPHYHQFVYIPTTNPNRNIIIFISNPYLQCNPRTLELAPAKMSNNLALKQYTAVGSSKTEPQMHLHEMIRRLKQTIQLVLRRLLSFRLEMCTLIERNTMCR